MMVNRHIIMASATDWSDALVELNLEGLSDEKRERVCNAAMREFASKGFDRASTNVVVKDAGIAKGLLFHYFTNKKQLFLYLYDYAIGLLMKEMQSKIDYGKRDFFERMRDVQIVKMQIIGRHPDIMAFLQTAYLEQSGDVRRELDERNRDLLQINMAMVFENIDTSSFRGDVDPFKVINTVVWALEGFGNSYLNSAGKTGAIDYAKMFAEAEAYMDFLRTCFTKP